MRSLLLRSVVLLIALIAAFALDIFRPQTDYSLSNIAYDSATIAPLHIQTPLDAAARFRLQFSVLVDAATDNDILQTSGPDGPSLRFVASPPHRLFFIPFGLDVAPVSLSTTFSLGQWHQITIEGQDNEHFDVALDGVVSHFTTSAFHQVQSSAEVGSKDFRFHFRQIDIGSGTTASKPLQGKIAKFSFASRYPLPLAMPLVVFADACIIIAVLWAFWPRLCSVRRPEITGRDMVASGVFASITLLGFLINALGLSSGKWAILFAMAAGVLLGIVVAGRCPMLVVPKRVAAFVLPFLMLLAVVSLSTLPNWIVIARMFEQFSFASVYVTAFALCLATIIVGSTTYKEVASYKVRLFAWLPYVLFMVLALRTDAVFSQINALHWDYFLGPMRAIRGGGWLLWDVPAQYGFLNVLIPALMPIHPVVDAFYRFQAATLFVCAALFYRTLHRILGVKRIAACAVVIICFFFADPLLIGPTPYPSSSTARFLWCYVLLAMAANNFLGSRPSIDRFARYGATAWILGCLWSAESAIYCTVMFYAPICTSLVLRSQKTVSRRLQLARAWAVLRIPLLSALAVFLGINFAYLIGLGHLPDWSMFTTYILSYSGGFHERPIPIFGPIVIVFSILLSGLVLLVAVKPEVDEGAACAVVTALALAWIISSYYLTSAYPIVIATLSPLFIFGAFIVIRTGAAMNKVSIQAMMLLPLIALEMLSVFWNVNALSVMPKLIAPNIVAWTHLPTTDPELTALLAQARVSVTTPIVYYDYWVAMPCTAAGPFDENWLPTPLQQLEEPITAPFRNLVIARYVARHGRAGYFIQAMRTDADPRVGVWRSLLSRYYSSQEVARSTNYRIVRFVPRTSHEVGTAQ